MGEAIKNAKLLDAVVEELATDHRPEAGASRKAKKSIANFGLRDGQCRSAPR